MCVRLIHMYGVDLAQFRFDYDLTWAAVFLNADGTVYGRYGTRDDGDPEAGISLEGLRRTMERVLELHEDHPGNAAALAAKRGPKPAFARPEDYPVDFMRIDPKPDEGNCIHCHMVHEADQIIASREGRYDPTTLPRYPQPQAIGVVMDPDDCVVIARVVDGSAAARAGLMTGDSFVSLAGQPVVSTADIQFVLNGTPGDAHLPAVVRRGDETVSITLELTGDWRRPNLAWRASMFAMPPRPRLWVEALNDSRRERLGLVDDVLGLEVRGVFGAQVKAAGVKEGDVIVAVDGETRRRSAGRFHEYIRLRHHRKGSVMTLEVRRGKASKTLTVKF